MSMRATLAENIKTLMGEEGKAYEYNDAHVALGPITVPSINVLLKGYRPAEERGALVGEFVVTIASPWLDVKHAESDLDGDVAALLLTIDRLDKTRWTAASRVVVEDKYHGWDLTVETLCQITTDTNPEA